MSFQRRDMMIDAPGSTDTRVGLKLRKKKSENNTNSALTSIERERLSKTVGLSFPAGHANPTPELTTYGGLKLGWIQGVLVPCLLNIWGVMLFLRISWIVGQAGIGLTVVIIFIAGVVCIITTISLSAICTNGELQGGGVYYLVSRSLGVELGASVGIIFAFANSVAASMNTIGFCDSLNELLKAHGLKIIDNSTNDIRIIGAIALLVMCVICAIGMDWETKTQNFLITVILLAIANFIIGACMGPLSDIQLARGFVGFSMETTRKNWYPDYRPSDGMDQHFFSIFAMYFPAVTGVQAGANICGDLRDPAMAIPKGTFLALAVSMTSYFVMAVLSGMGALRDASGNTTNLTAVAVCKPNCKYGLHNNYEIMQLMSIWAPLIYAGCWAATLSTALTNLLSVPRLIQTLGTDRIYPGFIYFSKRYGRHGEPYRGYVLVYCVSLLFLLIADLNMIAPLITNFYLASYALINFCAFHAGLIASIAWRPTFRFYNKWISILGFGLCLWIMMIISWVMALVTMIIFITLYLLVIYTKPDASWGSSTEAQRYRETVSTILQISRRVESIKSYNPQVLVLAGKPYSRPALLDIGHLITKVGSFMIVADIECIKMSYVERITRIRLGEDWMISRDNRAFYVLMNGFDLTTGLQALTECSGLGRLSPNIILIGFKTKWMTCSAGVINNYVRLIKYSFEEQQAVAILRVSSAARPPHIKEKLVPPDPSVRTRNVSKVTTQTQLLALMHSNSDLATDIHDYRDVARTQSLESQRQADPEQATGTSRSHSETRRNLLRAYQPLDFKQDKNVDAYWLYDDGGMNILLPYIIARRGFKEKRPYRIFTLVREEFRKQEAQSHMETLLKRFRIEYTQLVMIEGINDPPKESSWTLFNSVINNVKMDQPGNEPDRLPNDNEIKKFHAKTSRYLRLREMLLEHSSQASFIVMSLPKPRQGGTSACLYMTWLEVLSRDLPPMLMVRGNKEAVIDA